jgi:hypothetical protein
MGDKRFFNVLEDSPAELTGQNRSSGRLRWEYVSVPEDSYLAYVQFLTTSNPVHLRHAERLGS